MTVKKSSLPNESSPLRVPKAKNKLGLQIRNVPNIRMPHEDLIVSEKPELKIVENEPKKRDRLTRQTTQPSLSSQPIRVEISPKSNYQKVPNSITKEAIPGGLFKPGKSKHLWDVLYSLTRGAITPTRKIRMSKTKLMKKAAIGSRITFDSCVEHLLGLGLLKIQIFTGEHQGNEFEVLTPEEVVSMTSQSSRTSLTSPAQNLDRLLILDSSQTSHTLNTSESNTSEFLKTSFKTNTNDDESIAAFSRFIERFENASGKLTGKKISEREVEKWEALAELLILELEVAASRAGNISSVPAFLTEVLRRQFLAARRLPKTATQKSEKPSPGMQVGKNYSEPWQPEPLDAEGREQALAELRELSTMFKEMCGNGSVENHQQMYTPEDWQWLTEKLKISESEKQI